MDIIVHVSFWTMCFFRLGFFFFFFFPDIQPDVGLWGHMVALGLVF